MNKAQRIEMEAAREELRKIIPPGSTIYTVMRYCSRSGMYRAIDVYVMRDGEPWRVSFSVAKACDMRYDRRHEAIGVGRCGMDMGFHIVYAFSHCLYEEGFQCVGASCPSNDHSNGHEKGQRCERMWEDSAHQHFCTHAVHKTPGWHKEGGYALSHRWL